MATESEPDASSEPDHGVLITIYMEDETLESHLPSHEQSEHISVDGVLAVPERQQISGQDSNQYMHGYTTSMNLLGARVSLQLDLPHQMPDSDLQLLENKTYSPPQQSTLEESGYQTRLVDLSNGQTLEDRKPSNSSVSSIDGKAESVTQEDTKSESRRIDDKSAIEPGRCIQSDLVLEPNPMKQKPFDVGVESDDSTISPTAHNNKQTHHDSSMSNNNNKNWPLPPAVNVSMDQNRDADNLPLRSPTPKPLRIHKHKSQVQYAKSHQQLNQNKVHQEHHENTVYAPRPTATREFIPSVALSQSRTTRSDPASRVGDTTRSTVSSFRGQHTSDTSNGGAPATITARSTLSSFKEAYFSDESPSIMGDFVPINPLEMGSRPTTANDHKVLFHSSVNARRVPKIINPYEFEPSTPDNHGMRQSTAASFINSQDDILVSTPQRLHVKNARSEGNAIYVARPPTPPIVYTSKPTTYGIHRSESSPTVSPLRFSPPHERSLSPELYSRDDELLPQDRRGRQGSEDRYYHVQQDAGSEMPLPSRFPVRKSSMSPVRRSPQRPARPPYPESVQHARSRDLHRSPQKVLHDVSEQDELIAAQPRSSSPPPVPPKKRSRSPMKKMFGENGWLGQSADEKPELKAQPRKLVARGTGDVPTRKKTTMMGKLKNKLEEIAEKADLTFRSEDEKYTKLTMLSISLGPAEQARIYMEVELMLVHTANNFLMSQFSQGRVAVDSIKKTVDAWKGKGRPLVIEFMYDQSTQRELVLANQHNFRFHGATAGSEIRVTSMLYNWKQVANLMSIRTFCSADTIIMKLLFDIEQILELLGAGGPMMLRFQEIRTIANKKIRNARYVKDYHAATQGHSKTRAMDWNPAIDWNVPFLDGSESKGDSYGGLKLVPDDYVEE